VEAFPSADSFSGSATTTISRLQDNVLPTLQASLGNGVRLSLGGVAPEGRDFVHAVYGKFPCVLAFVVLLTFVLLMRAFRSVFLPLKAVILNLASLGAAFGIIVFVFQWGHGIIFGATVIRALLVPSVMRIAGRVNWWLPAPVERALLVRPHRPRTAEAE
jgi:uncharacterized membrane protein YdfJ with MMPL/SSD domain